MMHLVSLVDCLIRDSLYIMYMQVEEPKNNEEVQAAVPETEKKEEAADKKTEEAAKEPPPPCILGIDLHCTGCANKIKKCLLRCKGN